MPISQELLDILACPIDKNYPLELHEIKEKNNAKTIKNIINADLNPSNFKSNVFFCKLPAFFNILCIPLDNLTNIQ